jgi:hypothetical protein
MPKEAEQKEMVEPVRLASPRELLGQPVNRVRLAKPEQLGVPRPPGH